MRERERKLARKKLDEEMRPFRRAGREKEPTSELLRAVRNVLAIPVAEIAERMGVKSGAVWERENNEAAGTITMRTLERQAEAMGCKVVYGIVPEGGKTLERLAEERYWRTALGAGNEEPGTRDQGIGEGGEDGEREEAEVSDQRTEIGEQGRSEGGVRVGGSGGEGEAEMAGEWGGTAEDGGGPGGGGEQRETGQTAAQGCSGGEDGERAAAGNALREEGADASEETAKTVLG